MRAACLARRSKWMPAARCRSCGVVTWEVSLARGLRPTDEEHGPDCVQPMGRFDLLAQAKALGVDTTEWEPGRPVTRQQLEQLRQKLQERIENG